MKTSDLLRLIQEAIHTQTTEYTETRLEDASTLSVQFSEDKYLINVQRL